MKSIPSGGSLPQICAGLKPCTSGPVTRVNGREDLGHLLPLQVHWQQARSAAEQPGLQQGHIWNTGTEAEV